MNNICKQKMRIAVAHYNSMGCLSDASRINDVYDQLDVINEQSPSIRESLNEIEYNQILKQSIYIK